MPIRRRHWTRPELALLRREYPRMPAADLAARLGRSVRAVYLQAETLGLRREPTSAGRYAIGDLRMNPYGYVDIKVRGHGWRHFHLWLWEQANGPVPRGRIVSFRDGDRLNIELPNLELVTHAELMRRNTMHRFPAPLRSAIQLVGQLKRRIREREDRRPTQSPVRNPGRPARPRETHGHRAR